MTTDIFVAIDRYVVVGLNYKCEESLSCDLSTCIAAEILAILFLKTLAMGVTTGYSESVIRSKGLKSIVGGLRYLSAQDI